MRRGYTLIELMIAIVLLGIGASVLVSHFHQYHKASQRTVSLLFTGRFRNAPGKLSKSGPPSARPA